MASPSTVITMGLGSFGSASLLVTLGFGSNQQVVVTGPYIVADLGVFVPGKMTHATSEVFTPGSVDQATFTPGAVDQEIYT